MSQPHVIRLNRVWELRVLEELPAGAAAIDESVANIACPPRVDFPANTNAEQFTGGAGLLLTRRFNRPSNLSPEQPVFLRLTPLALGETACLNGQQLTPANKHEAQTNDTQSHAALHAVSGQIRENNRLDIVVSDIQWLADMDVRLVIYEIPMT